MAVERRRFPRVRADFGVKYKIKDSDTTPIKAVSINIGEGGIMMKISEKLDIGTALKLDITFPPPYGNIEVLAEVIYVLENYWDDYPPYRCGVELLDLKEKDKELIRKFVNEAIAKLDWRHWA
jgi:c-di-GMP-binding flagellar brake protein YcgR